MDKYHYGRNIGLKEHVDPSRQYAAPTCFSTPTLFRYEGMDTFRYFWTNVVKY